MAIIILIIGAPFALKEYSKIQIDISPTPTPDITIIPTIIPDPEIFNKHWCRNEGQIKHCYQFFPDNSYAFGSSDSHSELLMEDKWTILSKNKYEIPGQTFSYYEGSLVTTLDPQYGPFLPDPNGLVRTRG